MVKNKLPLSTKTLIGLSAMGAWPISLLMCYLERNNEDEETKEVLKMLKSSSKFWMIFEIIGVLAYLAVMTLFLK